MEASDYESHPTIVFYGALRRELVKSFSPDIAEALTTAVDVDISPGAATEAELTEMAALFTGTLLKMRRALHEQGFLDRDAALVALSRGYKITLN